MKSNFDLLCESATKKIQNCDSSYHCPATVTNVYLNRMKLNKIKALVNLSNNTPNKLLSFNLVNLKSHQNDDVTVSFI